MRNAIDRATATTWYSRTYINRYKAGLKAGNVSKAVVAAELLRNVGVELIAIADRMKADALSIVEGESDGTRLADNTNKRRKRQQA